MINRFTIAIFIFLFISIKHVYPQESRLEEIHSSKGYILVIWGEELLYFISSKYKNLDSENFRSRFRKENHRVGFGIHSMPDSLFSYLWEYSPNFREDSLKIYGSENKRSILIMPIKITYTGAIINEHKEQKKLDEVERFKYFKKHRIGEKYLYFDNGMEKHYIYDYKIDREIIDIKILSRPLR